MGRTNALKHSHDKDRQPPLVRAELPIETAFLARYLIGKLLVPELPEGVVSGRIVETEAYIIGDPAGHTYRGMTRRNRSLFLERGHAYVHLIYGISYMLNVSSETSGIGAGVLIRALKPIEGIPIMQRNRGIKHLHDLARTREGSPRRCGSIVSLMGSTFVEKVLYGWEALTRKRAKSVRALRSVLHEMRTDYCDFTCRINPFVSGPRSLIVGR